MMCINSDWTSTDKDGESAPYYSRQNELSIHYGCIMWGVRVVVPTKLRNFVISQIHDRHPRVFKIKNNPLARSFVCGQELTRIFRLLPKDVMYGDETRIRPREQY